MPTAELLAKSILIEGRGVFSLLWEDIDDLARALIVFSAAFRDTPVTAQLVSPGPKDILVLQHLVESRIDLEEKTGTEGKTFWILFLHQASSETVGPWLNGWRRPISEAPGTLIVVRHGDYEDFQRFAPDLASFIGPRISSASNMLSLVSRPIREHLRSNLPKNIRNCLERLPGDLPPKEQIEKWITESIVDDE